jgi:hypothetical protein
MVNEHLLGCFKPKDPSLGFSKLFHVVVSITRGDIHRSVALVLGASRLLAMERTLEVFVYCCG